eukprot:14773221-Alexandrium_andersonii.AAC.1
MPLGAAGGPELLGVQCMQAFRARSPEPLPLHTGHTSPCSGLPVRPERRLWCLSQFCRERCALCAACPYAAPASCFEQTGAS